MEYQKLFWVATIIFLLGACSKPIIQVTNVNDIEDYKVKDYQQPTLIYALPETVLNINIETQRTVIKHGPFAEYAKKYLSIDNAPIEDTENWILTNVTVSSTAKVDSNQFYIVKCREKSDANLLSLTTQGLLAGINTKYTKNYIPPDDIWFNSEPEYNKNQFTDLSIKRNFDKPADRPLYRRVKRDSTYVRVPVLEKQIVQKDMEKKAEEAANFIYKIRKRRAKLVDGEYDKFYEGKALKTALKEIARIEEEYLSLFIGKKYIEDYTYVMEFTPNNINRKIPNVLCRFSPDEGILDSDDMNGKPVLLKIDDRRTTNQLDKFIDKHKKALAMQKRKRRNTGFYYRIPDEAVITLTHNNKTLTSRNMTIAQYGSIAILPYTIANGNYSIEFYTEFGALKKIKKNKPANRKK